MTVLKFFFYLLGLAVLLSLFRWIEMLINLSYFVSSYDLLTNAFVGFRFDLLILSFLLMPLLMIFFINIRRKSTLVHFIDFLVMLVWSFISGIYFFNFLHLYHYQDLIWSHDWIKIFDVLIKSSAFEIACALIMALFLFLIGFLYFKKIRRIIFMANFKSQIVMLLILAFFARGSIGNDHLRRNDCDGRRNSVVRALCLNPVYVFLKVKNQEFGP